MTRFIHYPTSILIRPIHLIYDTYKSLYYLFDPNTALFAALENHVAKTILEECDIEKDKYVMGTLLGLITLEEKNRGGDTSQFTDVDNVITVSLAIRSDCNMSCTYCYNNHHYSKYNNKYLKRKIYKMDINIAISAIFSVLNELKQNEYLSVQFIGGEPLLDYVGIKKIIEETEKYASQTNRTVKFSLSTNGLLLDEEKADYFNKHKVRAYVSIDGSQRQHDKHRKLKNGQGSFEIIKKNLKQFFNSYEGRVRTCRITASTIDFDLVEAVNSCLELGFNNISIGISFVEILKDIPKEERENVIEDMIMRIKELKDYCLIQYSNGALFRVGLFHSVMFNLYAYRPQFVTCGALRRYVAVSPNGDVVPCHRFIGTSDKSKIIGNILSNGALGSLNINSRRCSIKNNQFYLCEEYSDCNSCWIRHLCGGLCYEVGEQIDKHSITKDLFCKFRKELIKEVFEMYIVLKENPKLFHNIMMMNADLQSEEALKSTFIRKLISAVDQKNNNTMSY